MREKQTLIKQIQTLISINGESVDINPNYLEYFDVEELEAIKQELCVKKESIKESTKAYVEELYGKFLD